jgi:hypothetical protein
MQKSQTAATAAGSSMAAVRLVYDLTAAQMQLSVPGEFMVRILLHP